LIPLFRPSLPIDRPDFHLLYRKAHANSAEIRALKRWLSEVTAGLERRARAANV
jgi:DNA-binding transcriptional LysR family regulator